MNITGMVHHLGQFIAPVLPYVSSACRNQSLEYIRSRAQDFPWALAMSDASAKPQAGLLEGNVNSLGHYDGCINVKPPLFSAQHCITVLGLSKGPPKTPIEDMLDSRGMFWGICLPSACSTSDVTISLNEWLRDWNIKVIHMSCQDSLSRPMEIIDWFAVSILIILGLLILLSTAYDAFYEHNQRVNEKESYYTYDIRTDFFTSFSILRNGHELLKRASPSDLATLYGIRLFSICWIMMSNTINTLMNTPATNYLYVWKLVQSWTFMPNVRFSLAVESFLMVSGLLASLKFLTSIPQDTSPKRMSQGIIVLYVHRYLRIAPTLAMLILLQVSLWRHAGSGPLWDSRTAPLAESCYKNWYWALLFIQNYAVGHKLCLEHSWYLNVDLQLYLLSPLVIIPLLYWKEWICLLMLAFLIISGFISSFLVNYLNEFPAGYIIGDPEKRAAQNRYFVITTHTRFVSYVIGILVGYLLYNYKTKDIKPRFRLSTQILLWLATFTALIYAVFGALPFHLEDYKYESLSASAFIAAVPIIWAMGVGWIVFSCETQHCALLSNILGYRGLQPLGRLVYCIYLGNRPLINLQASSLRVPVYISFSGAILDFIGTLGLAIIFGVLLFLGVERPCTRIGYIASKWICMCIFTLLLIYSVKGDKIAGAEVVETVLAPVVLSTVLHAPTRVLASVPSVGETIVEESEEELSSVKLPPERKLGEESSVPNTR